MHRHQVMYNNVYTHYPSLPYRHHRVNVCSSYDIAEPLPISHVNIGVPSYYHNYGYRRGIDYIPRSLPPIVQTSVQNDIRYYFDEPNVIYDDDYGNAYRLSRSKIQLVDLAPKNNVRTTRNPMVVSTYRTEEVPERILIPRSTFVRHTSLLPYKRVKPVRLVPLYRSANPRYVVTSRI
jgi:hypothetical protein